MNTQCISNIVPRRHTIGIFIKGSQLHNDAFIIEDNNSIQHLIKNAAVEIFCVSTFRLMVENGKIIEMKRGRYVNTKQKPFVAFDAKKLENFINKTQGKFNCLKRFHGDGICTAQFTLKMNNCNGDEQETFSLLL